MTTAALRVGQTSRCTTVWRRVANTLGGRDDCCTMVAQVGKNHAQVSDIHIVLYLALFVDNEVETKYQSLLCHTGFKMMYYGCESREEVRNG